VPTISAAPKRPGTCTGLCIRVGGRRVEVEDQGPMDLAAEIWLSVTRGG
jgi:hypothetical protein